GDMATDPHALFDQTTGKLHFWFNRPILYGEKSKTTTWYLTSQDGMTFSGTPVKAVIPGSLSTDSDHSGTDTFSAIFDSDSNKWIALRMVYPGDYETLGQTHAIVFSTASRPEGPWTGDKVVIRGDQKWEGPWLMPFPKSETNPQPIVESDPSTYRLALFGGTGEPSLHKINGALVAWYYGSGLYPPSGGYRTGHAIGVAVSFDNGVTWIKHPTPVFERGSPGSWDDWAVAMSDVQPDPRGGYHLFYGGYKWDQEKGKRTPQGIGHAFSWDGITWTKNPNNPIIPLGPAGAWDSGHVIAPSAELHNNEWWVYYFAANIQEIGSNERIGLAKAKM
ncbi:MAG: hypothetical protein AABW64_04220, partial [Nanoarchaeota archaeon]